MPWLFLVSVVLHYVIVLSIVCGLDVCEKEDFNSRATILTYISFGLLVPFYFMLLVGLIPLRKVHESFNIAAEIKLVILVHFVSAMLAAAGPAVITYVGVLGPWVITMITILWPLYLSYKKPPRSNLEVRDRTTLRMIIVLGWEYIARAGPEQENTGGAETIHGWRGE